MIKASGQGRARWSLCGCEGAWCDICTPLVELPCQVGRRTSLPLCLPNPSVSGLHAEFFLDGGSLLLRDLGSTNGTYVNGKRITAPVRLHPGDMVQFADAVFRLEDVNKDEVRSTFQMEDASDLALALSQFDRLLSERAVVPHYQVIVSARDGSPWAYEVLGRSRLYGLNNPRQMFRAAERLKMESELSRLLRHEGIQRSCPAGEPPHLFVNTHPAELADLPTLIRSLEEARLRRPEQPITLEIHESATANLSTMKQIQRALRDMNIGLAFDDFGAGQSRLEELVEARPDYVKFDMQLIRGIDVAPFERQRLLSTLVKMSRDLGIRTLAEGVESMQEATYCSQIGFEYFQGYLFGKPTSGPAAFSPTV